MADRFFADDLEVLNYALTLEHLEAEFYDMANASGVLTGDAAAYLQIIGDHERAHVDALTAAISEAGGTPVMARASYNFDALGDMSTQEGILAIANVLEPTGVAAYNGAASEIMDTSILSTAGAIVQVEANHAAIIRVLIDPEAIPAPAFESVTPPQEILDAVGPLLGPEQ
jgi:rubrerythrin